MPTFFGAILLHLQVGSNLRFFLLLARHQPELKWPMFQDWNLHTSSKSSSNISCFFPSTLHLKLVFVYCTARWPCSKVQRKALCWIVSFTQLIYHIKQMFYFYTLVTLVSYIVIDSFGICTDHFAVYPRIGPKNPDPSRVAPKNPCYWGSKPFHWRVRPGILRVGWLLQVFHFNQALQACGRWPPGKPGVSAKTQPQWNPAGVHHPPKEKKNCATLVTCGVSLSESKGFLSGFFQHYPS